MKKTLITFLIFCSFTLTVKAQKTPVSYLGKTPNEITQEFKDTSDFIVSINGDSINVKSKSSNYLMRFVYNSEKKIDLIFFATDDHETAQAFFDTYDKEYLDMGYTEKVRVDDGHLVKWSTKHHIITFGVQNQSRYPFRFTYSIQK